MKPFSHCVAILASSVETPITAIEREWKMLWISAGTISRL